MRGWLLLLLLLLVGCGRVQNERVVGGVAPEQGAEMTQLELPAMLQVGVPAELTVRLVEGTRRLEGASVFVEGNMTHAGMEPLHVEATEVAPGEYRARLEWSMAGEWFLTVESRLPDGRTLRRTLESLQVRAR